VPSAHAIKTWLKDFEGRGPTLKTKPPGKRRTVRTTEKVGRVMTAFHHSPQQSARHHAVSLNISSSSVQQILWKDLQFHPYKIQVLQELKERDFISHTNFCRVFLTRLDDIHNLFMSNKAHFHFSGYVNKQNFRYWANINPDECHQAPLHSEKVTVWCVLSSFEIIGPFF
jgi:ribosomal protein L25 (general stress protein Ctc)